MDIWRYLIVAVRLKIEPLMKQERVKNGSKLDQGTEAGN